MTTTSLILQSKKSGVTTITMNAPRRYNGWTAPMMDALFGALDAAATDPETKALVLTGADPYYCAGVNLSGVVSLAPPKVLRERIRSHNQRLFDAFIDFPKPILVAVNGPAIGASVTSATLCDGIIASDKATFSTPFALVAIAAEGCSTVHLPRLMGQESTQRMIGPEGWVPTATEALAAGLVQWVTPHATLLDEAQRIAEGWIAEGAKRTFRGGSQREELKAVNARESEQVADTALSSAFLKNQYRFLRQKKKHGPAAVFFSLWLLRPLWGKLL